MKIDFETCIYRNCMCLYSCRVYFLFYNITERSSPKPVKSNEDEEIVVGSPQENEFVSDTFQNDGHISDEDLKKEMQMLGMEDEGEKVEGEIHYKFVDEKLFA